MMQSFGSTNIIEKLIRIFLGLTQTFKKPKLNRGVFACANYCCFRTEAGSTFSMLTLSKFLAALAVMTLFAAPAGFAEGVVEAKKDGVKVTSEPSRSGSVLATLKKGDSLDAEGRKGMFWQVKLDDGKTGYVSVMAVKRGLGKAKGISDAIRAAAKEARDEEDVSASRQRTAVMGVRGLDESDETQFAGNLKPDFDLVYRMEDRQISNKDITSLESRVQNEIMQRMKARSN